MYENEKDGKGIDREADWRRQEAQGWQQYDQARQYDQAQRQYGQAQQ